MKRRQHQKSTEARRGCNAAPASIHTKSGLRGLFGRACKKLLGLRSDEGGAIVELALTVPMFMSLMTGTISFSLAFYSLQQLQSATSSAVQALAATADTNDDPCNQAMTIVQAALPGWTTSKLSYSLLVTNAAGSAATYTSSSGAFACAAAGAGGGVSTQQGINQATTLTVTYSYTWLPVLNFSPSSNLSASQSAMAE